MLRQHGEDKWVGSQMQYQISQGQRSDLQQRCPERLRTNQKEIHNATTLHNCSTKLSRTCCWVLRCNQLTQSEWLTCLNSVWKGIGFFGGAHKGPAVSLAEGTNGSSHPCQPNATTLVPEIDIQKPKKNVNWLSGLSQQNLEARMSCALLPSASEARLIQSTS